ncbi:MAG: hypothetical protein LBT89_04595, partial [Planctomycetaceae bacterium]|nr:hypothetical protein [Planctomycetaceae bacterium]
LTEREKTILKNIETDAVFCEGGTAEPLCVPIKKRRIPPQEIPHSELPDDFHKAEEMLESNSGQQRLR